MAETTKVTGELKPTLGLTGVTINAMALIAPGAFLWTTFQEQSAWGGPSMWSAVLCATFIALMTASCYAVFAAKYPQAGAGSSYFYAEQSFLEKESHNHFKLARLAKLIVGIAAHVYYWIYPAVMVSFMGTLVVWIGQLFNPNFATHPAEQMGICVLFAALVGFIAYIGITGSTFVNVLINIIQILTLVIFGIGAICFRLAHPGFHYEQSGGLATIMPHNATQFLFQSTIAILLVVGFESCTALAGEAKNPKKDIPRAVILSLIIQAVICYLFEYFGANFFIGSQYAGAVDKNGANFTLIDPSKVHAITDHSLNQATYAGGSIVSGYAASADDSAPIGSFCKIIGDWWFHGGFTFEFLVGLTVVLALLGTTLSCLNTGVRVTYAMGKDNELPGPFGFLHGKYNTPHIGIIVLTAISAVLGAYGVLTADHLLQITLISNLGTFALYGLTCFATYIAFSHVKNANVFTTKLIPFIGVVMNFGLMVFDLYFAFVSPSATAATKFDTKVALVVTVGFTLLSFLYLGIRSMMRGEPFFLPPDHKDELTPASSS